jgi:sugar transferase (PEP-CTERM system associated)
MIRLFRVFFPTTVLALLVSEILILFFSFIFFGLFFLDVDPTFFLIEEDGLLRIAIVVASILLGLYMQDLYGDLRVLKRILLVQQLCMSMGVAFLVQALLGYGRTQYMLPRSQMIFGSLLGLILLVIIRIAYSTVVVRSIGAQRLLLVGNSPVLAEVAGHVAGRPELGVIPIGHITENSETAAGISTVPHLGMLEEIRAIVERTKPDRIVIGMAERRQRLPVNELLQLRLSGIRIEEVAATYEMAFGRVCLRELRPSHLIFSEQLGPSQASVEFQAIYSMVIALASVVLLSPLLALAAVLVKISSRGPILYRQTRVGLEGKLFTVYKFRSMYEDAEAHTGAVWAQRDDPRITPIGRFLRKTRLDEIPQIFNVLRGEMSMVGPRPERPEFVKTLSEQIPFYRQRHCIKPGVTGWAQINYKYGDSLEDTITKLEYDLYYIKNISFALDTYILVNTLKTVLLGRGAQ